MRLWGYVWVDWSYLRRPISKVRLLETWSKDSSGRLLLCGDSVGVLARSCLIAFWGETLDEV